MNQPMPAVLSPHSGRWAIMFFLMVLLSACSTFVPAPSVPVPSAVEANAAWARVLREHVNTQGEVDFPALARQRSDLDRYVRYLAQVPLEQIPDGAARLAHMINGYNALSMFNVIESGIPLTHAGFAKVRFFLLRKLEFAGQAISLYALENQVIRPYGMRDNDPRLHFALNCSALACPALPRMPFTAEALDAELEREARAFFARPENFRIEPDTRTVWLSELLNFYPEDFVPKSAPSLLAYANRYVAVPAPLDFQVRFVPYDWTIVNSKRLR